MWLIDRHDLNVCQLLIGDEMSNLVINIKFSGKDKIDVM